MKNSERERLQSWAQDLGIHLTPHQINLLSIYLDELWEWNKKINLTGLTSPKEIVHDLLIDSMIPSKALPDRGRLLDVGSGAGFPGIPLIICKPKLTAHFVEPNNKKVSFLKQILRLTELRQINVICGRIETSSHQLNTEGFHIITARAVAHLSQVLQWCAPYLLPGGLLVNFQGDQFEKVLEESLEEMKRQGLSLHMTLSYTLPEKENHRNILIFKKG